MAVEVRSAQIRSAGRVMTQVFPRFLDQGLHYRVDEILPGPSVAQEWHQHEGEEVLIPLRGAFRLEYREGGSPATLALTIGSRHTVPPGLAHRLVTTGGLVESFRSEAAAVAAQESWIEGEEGGAP